MTVLPNGVTIADKALIKGVQFAFGMIHCYLKDGRKISVPLKWYPKLLNATHEQRDRWELIGQGVGLHWPDLDEDLSLHGFMAGAEDW